MAELEPIQSTFQKSLRLALSSLLMKMGLGRILEAYLEIQEVALLLDTCLKPSFRM